MKTIPEILKAAGGARSIHEASVAEAGADNAIKTDAVYKWSTIGIPDRHWPLIMRLSGASADEMLSANVAARTKGAA